MLVLGICLIALTSSVASGCCLPKQWEGMETITIGSIANGTVRVTQEFMNVSADTTIGMVAVTTTVTSGIAGTTGQTSHYLVIQDYNKQIQYVVDKDKNVCSKSTLTRPGSFNCVPSNSTIVTKTTIGSDHTPGTIYKIPFGTIGDGYLTISDKGCIPVSYTVTSNLKDMQSMESVGIYDVTEGIMWEYTM